MNIRFSHRPQVGISIGVYVENNTAYLSAAFQNAKDKNFNRRIARAIITSRIQSRIATSEDVRFTAALPVPQNTDSGKLIHLIRERFKPDIEETDDTFYYKDEFGGVETRVPASRDVAWYTIVTNFEAATKDESLCGS